MKTLRRKIKAYFQEPEAITNGWIDLYRGWPVLNLILMLACLACLILDLTGFDLNPYLVWPLYGISAISLSAEIIHFWVTTSFPRP